MAKLGEAKLGSTQFSEPGELGIDSEIDEAVRSRAEEVMKSVYPTAEGTNWDKILGVVLHEFKREHEVLSEIINGRFIEEATGAQLDMIGEMWQLERRTDERDGHFRARIKAQFPRHTSRATIEEIRDVTAILLKTETGRVLVDENFDIEPARFDVFIEEIVFHTSEITISEYEALLQDIRPAGVNVTVTIGEQFTHRSVSDFDTGTNATDKAYDGYDPATIEENPDGPDQLTDTSTLLDTGGEYADEITQQYT